MRLVALGDRDPAHLTHREIDATLALLAGDVECGWVATERVPVVPPRDRVTVESLDAVLTENGLRRFTKHPE